MIVTTPSADVATGSDEATAFQPFCIKRHAQSMVRRPGSCTRSRSPVGSRTGAPAGLSTVPRFQPPPRRTQHADFPHCALPFASLQGLWDLSRWGRFRSVASHSIAVEQHESVVQPRPIPPLPAEALSFPSMRQMAPDLLLHPIFDEAEARRPLEASRRLI